MTPRPLPPPDLDSGPWWQALARNELVIQRCASCERRRWPARVMCNDCGSFEAEWIASCGTGVVVSWTVTHHSFGPDVEVPFVVALVRIDDQDDIYIPGYVDAPNDGHTMAHGLRVAAGYDTVPTAAGDPLTVLRWRLAG